MAEMQSSGGAASEPKKSEKKPVIRTTHVREEKPEVDPLMQLVQSRKREQQEAAARASAINPIVIGSSSPGDCKAPTSVLPTPQPATAPTPAAAVATKTEGGGSNTPSRPQCPICLEPFKSPFSAVCGHICCHACWQSWLQQKLECPVCKEKVRFKQLRKVCDFVVFGIKSV